MKYPTMEQVQKAERVQLCRWYRWLPPCGHEAIGEPDFETVMRAQAKIISRIYTRFKELGGMTPKISKEVGWDKP